MRRILAAAAQLAVVGTLIVSAPATANAAERPSFQMPFPCGETWYAIDGHSSPGDAIDWNLMGEDLGRPVVASADGVAVASTQGLGGNVVTINHGGGWSSVYAHLQYPGSSGSVRAGDVIGYVGASGQNPNISGPHLHWEQLYNGVRQPLYANGTQVIPGASLYSRSYTSANCGSGATTGNGQVFEAASGTGWSPGAVANPATPSVIGSVTSAIVRPDGTKVIYTVRSGEVWEAASSTGWQNRRTGISGVSNDAISAIVREDGVTIIYTLRGGEVWEAASNAGWQNNRTGISGVSNTALSVIRKSGVTFIYTVSGGAVYESASTNGWRLQGTGISGVSNTALAAVVRNGVTFIYTISGGAVYESAGNNGWRLQGTGISGVSNTALAVSVGGSNIQIYTVRNGAVMESLSGNGWASQNTGVVGASISAVTVGGQSVIYVVRR